MIAGALAPSSMPVSEGPYMSPAAASVSHLTRLLQFLDKGRRDPPPQLADRREDALQSERL
jgi:septal ring factor EnvC (AmiA/AmiB activator)